MSKDATSVGQIGLDLVLNQKKFKKQLSGIEGVAKKTGAKIGAAIAAGLTIKALTNFAKSCLDLGSDLQEVQNVVDTAFPSMSKQVDSFAKNAATSFGLSETMAKRYIGTFGAMSKSFGFTEREAYSMSAALTGLAGDIASFYNISQDEAYTKLKSVFTGETETLKDLGVVMTQANLDQYALANGFGKTTSAMTEQEKVALRYQFVMSQLSLAQGDFVKTSGSWANQIRILTLQFESFKAAIGQGLINILTPVIQWLNVLMSKLVAAANAFKRFTETLTGKKSQPIVLNNTSDGVTAVADGASNANNAVNNVTKSVKKLKRELAGFDQINKLGEVSPSSGSPGVTSGGSGSASTVNTAIDTDGETKKVEKLTQKYKAFGNAVEKLKKSFKGFTDVVGKGLKWAYDNVLKPLGNWAIKKWIPSVIELWASAFDALTAILKVLAPVFKILWDVLKPVIKFIGKFFISQIKTLTKGFRTYANILNKHVVPFTEKLYKGWKNLLKIAKELPNKIKEIPEKIKEWFSEKIEGAEEWFGGIKDAFHDALSNLTENLPDLSGIGGTISENIGEIKAKISGAIETTKDWWSDVKAKMAEKIEGIKVKISGALDTASDWWSAVKTGILNKLGDIKKAVSAYISTKADTLKDSLKKKLSNMGTIKKSFTAYISTTAKTLKNSLKKKLADMGTFTKNVKLKLTATVSNLKTWINSNIIKPFNKKSPIDIPLLAQGGYVKKNTPQLAMIGDNRHQGEVVAPERKLEEMAFKAASMAGGGVTPELIAILKEILAVLNALELNVYLDGKQVKKRIVDLINANTKATGVCEIIV